MTVDCISLIGMPGAGKSTLGVLLAKKLAKDFCDTDLFLQKRIGCCLQEYLDVRGHLALREQEEQVLLNSEFSNQIIATGGSAVYSKAGMTRLKSLGPVVLLSVSEEELLRRIDDMQTRGIARHPEQGFHEVYLERMALYECYADITVNCDGKTMQQVLAELINQLSPIL